MIGKLKLPDAKIVLAGNVFLVALRMERTGYLNEPVLSIRSGCTQPTPTMI